MRQIQIIHFLLSDYLFFCRLYIFCVISKDEGYNFINSIKGNPAYWKKFLLGMVKQVGVPTFFTTLSCADLQWDELISIIGRLKGEKLTSERISSVDYFERCNYLNFNPVLLAHQFQYRIEAFFQAIVLSGPLGRVKYYAIRVDFQVRGSPHIHSFLRILSASVLSKDNIQEYITLVDGIIKPNVPDINKNEELCNLVTAYQVHSHSKSCRKYNNNCRYNFGKFFSNRTNVAVPFSDRMSDDEKYIILQKRETILCCTVQEFINEQLDPRKGNILNQRIKADYKKVPSITDILYELVITEDEYYNALSISTILAKIYETNFSVSVLQEKLNFNF